MYEIRSSNSGAFNIHDRTSTTTRYSISSTGAHGITGNTTITGDLTITGTTTGITQAMILNLTDSLAAKANASNVYTKTDIDNALLLKANASDVSASLALKANIALVSGALDLKANRSTTYTKN